MTNKRKMVDEIIKSLETESNDWVFGDYTADNKKTHVNIWIRNIPILNLHIVRPVEISFNIIDKIRIYLALERCKVNIILSANKPIEP